MDPVPLRLPPEQPSDDVAEELSRGAPAAERFAVGRGDGCRPVRGGPRGHRRRVILDPSCRVAGRAAGHRRNCDLLRGDRGRGAGLQRVRKSTPAPFGQPLGERRAHGSHQRPCQEPNQTLNSTQSGSVIGDLPPGRGGKPGGALRPVEWPHWLCSQYPARSPHNDTDALWRARRGAFGLTDSPVGPAFCWPRGFQRSVRSTLGVRPPQLVDGH